MKVTKKQLNALNACSEAVTWFLSKNTNNIFELYELAKKEDHLDWANWYITRIMSHEQQIKYAVFAAELVLHFFEASYPNDDRPKNAIIAAKKVLENPSRENSKIAAAAAAAVAAAAVAYARADAAYAAYAASDAAAAYAAHAAAAAAYGAYAAAAAAAAYGIKRQTQIKILDYGLSLLE